ncbi:transmembrane protein 60 [Stegostoma tigrinum]|uniref:transmembrane protein 60 n=1 Tax=Stegostoma tigrinum TaxID=3053191 RepID=UPI00202B6C69|nr:transmembrane protein 60 [Stegostoma tigrinum]
MSLGQRVLMTWLFTLLFLIVLVLKLDDQTPWNWILIFMPLWIFDTILLMMLIVKIIRRCKSGYDRNSNNLKKDVWYFCAMLFKLSFLLALSARLEHFSQMKLTFVFIPLWLLLIGAVGDLVYNMYSMRQD